MLNLCKDTATIEVTFGGQKKGKKKTVLIFMLFSPMQGDSPNIYLSVIQSRESTLSLDLQSIERIKFGTLTNEVKSHTGRKPIIAGTSESKACAGLLARLRLRNVGFTERSSGLSPLIWSGRMNSDIKDLLVGASLPAGQRHHQIAAS